MEVVKVEEEEEEEEEAFLFFDAFNLISCSSSSLSDTGREGCSSTSAVPVGSETDKTVVFAPDFRLRRAMTAALLVVLLLLPEDEDAAPVTVEDPVLVDDREGS
jgi:hypothetical protein